MVFLVARDAETGRLYLDHLASGVRHPARPATPSVYQVAHRRLHLHGR